jgi:hypothetical protein
VSRKKTGLEKIFMVDLNAEISEDLKTQFDIACIKRGINKKEGVTEALQTWLGDKPEASPSPYMVKLERILASNDEEVINVVTLNIDVFFERMRPRTKPPARKRTGT